MTRVASVRVSAARVRAYFGEDPLDLKGRFQVGVAWNLAAALFKQGGTFVAGVIVANVLGRELFGHYAIVLSTVQAVAVVAGLGTGYTATRYVAELRDSDRERAGRVLGLCFAVALLSSAGLGIALLYTAPGIARHMLAAPELATALQLAALIIAATTLAGFFTGALAGLEAYRVIGRAAIATSVVHIAGAAALAAVAGLIGAVLALLVASGFQMLLLGRLLVREAARHSITMRLRGLGAERRVLFVFALPGALSGLTATPALWLIQVRLVQHGGGFEQLALYSAAFSCMAMVLLVPHVANNVGMSLLNNLLGLRRPDEFRKLFWANLLVTLSLTLAGAAVIAAGGRLLLGLFGPGFGQGYGVLLIMLAATVPEALTIACNQVLQSREKMWHAILLVNVPRDTLLVLLGWYLAPQYGAAGLAATYLLARTIAFALIAAAVVRLGLTVRSRELGAPVAEPA